MITFAASVGCQGSQNTYLDLSQQMIEVGPQGIKPPNRPAMEQQEEYGFSKPATLKKGLISSKLNGKM